MALPRSQPNFLAGPYLNRLTHLRKSAADLRSALDDAATVFVPVWQSRNLIAPVGEAPEARFVSGAATLRTLAADDFILLGQFHDHVYFAVAVPGEASPSLDVPGEFHDLRTIAGQLPREEAGLLAYARAMVSWRERHRYCGRCGARTVALQGGHVLQCTNTSCNTQQFPRIDPAIIVLVTEGERCLLGRQAEWPAGRYSTIAGFVEPGESLEDAVAREVHEETGIVVDGVDYHSSQPWPFPSSLMLGFMAHAASTQIQRTDEELEDALWVTREQIAAGEVALPTTHSISFRLIEDWYDAAADVPLREAPRARLWTAPPRR